MGLTLSIGNLAVMVKVVLVVERTAVQLECRMMLRVHRTELLWHVPGRHRYQPKPEWQKELM